MVDGVHATAHNRRLKYKLIMNVKIICTYHNKELKFLSFIWNELTYIFNKTV